MSTPSLPWATSAGASPERGSGVARSAAASDARGHGFGAATGIGQLAGVRADLLPAFAVAEFKKKGIDYTASLVGHGMGPWFHQQEPVLRRNSDIVLEKGMILAVEPQRLHWHLRDLVLIGDGAPQLLSDKFPTNQPFVVET